MNADEAKSALESEIKPLVANVFLADQSYYLLKTSGDFADGLNAALLTSAICLDSCNQYFQINSF